MKKILIIILTLILAFTLAMGLIGCGANDSADESATFDINTADFDSIVKEADGQTVSFYGWGGNDVLNDWIDNTLAPALKDEYNVTLNRVPMDIDEILAKLASENQAGTEKGSIDMIWINGENFYSAKDNGFLFGPFTDKLPNFEKYIDPNDDSVINDSGFPIEGYEAPYSKAQFVMTIDTAKTPEPPKNAAEFKEFAKANKGKVTYPALPDFTGSAFVRTIIHDLVGYDELAKADATKESVKPIIQPAIDYLKELNPYLWNKGKTFPSTLAQLDNMFADGEVVMTMSYDPWGVLLNIENGTFTDTSKSFIFDKGTIGNTNFIAIANNSPNKAGAIVAINEVLSVPMQASKYEQVKLLPVLDNSKLSEEEQAKFDAVDLGKGALDQSYLLERQIPEIPANLWPVIEEIWLEEVVGK